MDSSRLRQWVALVSVILFLGLTYVGLFWWLREITQWTLVPYDDIEPDLRPPKDTWQRQLNDYFEVTYQQVAWLFVGSSAVLYLIALNRSKVLVERVWLGIGFAASNLMLMVTMGLCAYLLSPLPPLSFLEPTGHWVPGYGWTYKFIVGNVMLLSCWLWVQVSGIPRWASTRARGHRLSLAGRSEPD